MTPVAVAPRQNQIKRVLAQSEAIASVQRMLKEAPAIHRSELASRVCDHFGFHDARGDRQLSGCLKALRELADQGAFELPPPQSHTGPSQPRRLGHPAPPARHVPDQVEAIEDLRLVEVRDLEQMRIWNELMIREHPDGCGPLVGRQGRYLIRSEHGWLGGLAFAASALTVRAREDWIGWDADIRRAHLDKLVSMSRFLIRNDIHCQNLASRVLGMASRQLPQDFEREYGYRPWLLETFVDTNRFSGTCYRAANWLCVGQTQGRGRQDQHNQAAKTVKDIYIYPLVSDFRKRLGLPPHAGQGPLPVDYGLTGPEWAEQEFGAAPLGDRRLSQRLVRVAQAKAEHPELSMPQVFQADLAALRAYYRLIAHPDTDAVSLSTMLEAHRECTLRRMQGRRHVLAIHDETDLDYASLRECEGLGVIGTNQSSTESRGLSLHSTFVVTPQGGNPLGLLRMECVAPKLKPGRKGKDRRYIPTEDKDTQRWIDSLKDTVDAAHKMPGTTVINVMDREADFFELFDAWRCDPRGHLLVRAQHDRRISAETTLFESVRRSRVQARAVVHLCRRSARPKKGKCPALPARPARDAQVQLRYKRVVMKGPRYGLYRHKAPIPVWIIHVVEKQPPKGQKPIEWFLLTTKEIDSVDGAMTCMRWYSLRWRIEDWHKVLQSGCHVEDAAHDTAERLQRVMAIHGVVAWRILLLTHLGRQAPGLPADVAFSKVEVEVLRQLGETLFKKKARYPACLGDALALVAMLGGYLGRNNDSPPGYQVLWRGLSAFHFICQGYLLPRGHLGPDWLCGSRTGLARAEGARQPGRESGLLSGRGPHSSAALSPCLGKGRLAAD